jgi:hypothetical protein
MFEMKAERHNEGEDTFEERLPIAKQLEVRRFAPEIDSDGAVFSRRFRRWVAYLLAADKYSGLLASRLIGVSQPVIRTRNAFSTLRLPQLVCL